jgi:hypothetical protein|tara:strand:- start:20 stop:271 length:252 start_codon:yes stop_codon:yes gene_type:complete
MEEIIAPVDDVVAFCREGGTRPPPCITRKSGRLDWLNAKDLAPTAEAAADNVISAAKLKNVADDLSEKIEQDENGGTGRRTRR